MRILFWLMFFLNCWCLTSPAQSCSDTSFRKSFTLNASDVTIVNQQNLADHSTLLTGQIKPTSAAGQNGLILRIDKMGAIQWAKQFSTSYPDLNFIKISTSSNGDLLAAGTLNNNSLVLAKLTSSGNLIWQYQYILSSNYTNTLQLDISALELSSDNSIILGADYAATKDGELIDIAHILKIDPSGSLIWDLTLPAEAGSPMYLMGVTLSSSIQVWTHAADGYCQGLDPRSISITSIDPETGAFLNRKKYCFPHDASVTSFSFIRHAFKISPASNGYTIYGSTGESSPERAYLLASFSIDAEFKEGFLLSRPSDFTLNSITHAVSGKDLTYIARTSNSPGNFVLSTIDLTNSLNRQRLIQLEGIQLNLNFLKAGQLLSTKTTGAITLSMSYKTNNQPTIEFFQWQKSDATSLSCLGSDTIAPSTWKPFSLLASGDQIPVILNNISNAVPIPLTSSNLQFTSINKCQEINQCNRIRLTGKDTICQLEQSYQYLAKLNENCSKRVQFITDSSQFGLFHQVNDSVVEVRFKTDFRGPRTITLIAQLQDCTPLSDTLVIQLFNGKQEIKEEERLCPGDTLVVSPGSWFKSYHWSDGSTDSLFTITAPGTLALTYSSFCNESYNHRITVLDGGKGKKEFHERCQLDTLTLQSNAIHTPISWLPQQHLIESTDATARALPDTSILYTAQYRNAFNCLLTDSFEIKVHPIKKDFLPDGFKVCKEEVVSLSSTTTFKSYQWNTGETNPTIRINQTGAYILTGIDSNNCQSSDTSFITMETCRQRIVFPNVFSPNNDHRNDHFKPVVQGGLSFYRLSIFNRWGQLIFQTEKPEVGWNGTIKEKLQNNDVFSYRCEYAFAGETRQHIKGLLMIVK